MQKNLEHIHSLDLKYSVVEDEDFPEREEIMVKVTEFDHSTFEDEIAMDKHHENNYLELNFVRILMEDLYHD